MRNNKKMKTIHEILLTLSLTILIGCKKNDSDKQNQESIVTSPTSSTTPTSNTAPTSNSNPIPSERPTLSINEPLASLHSSNSRSYTIQGICDSNMNGNVSVVVGEPQITSVEVPCSSNIFTGTFDVSQTTSDEIIVTVTHGEDTQSVAVVNDIHHFVTVWTIDSKDKFTLPLKSNLKYDFIVDWGDNSGVSEVTSFDDPDKVHTYFIDGVYTITIMGLCEGFQNNVDSSKDSLLQVNDLGNVGWKDLSYAFSDNSLLKTVFGGNTSKVTDMRAMFFDATQANPDTSEWDTSNVIHMRYMFFDATQANPDVSKWDTSSVTDMSAMFFDATQANPDVSKWDISKVTNMGYMFENATQANPDVSKWDTSKVTNMEYMFYYATQANPDVGKWNFTNISDQTSFLNYSSLSIENYSKFLIQFNKSTPTTRSTEINVGTLKYNSSAALAYASLRGKGWTIIDGGQE